MFFKLDIPHKPTLETDGGYCFIVDARIFQNLLAALQRGPNLHTNNFS